MAKGITIEKLKELIDELDIARSAVFVSAIALDHGETDLELQSARALKKASEMLEGISDELVGIWVWSEGRAATGTHPVSSE